MSVDVTLLTFGHGTATAEQISALLRGAGVEVVVDIRTAPGSRRHPHVVRSELEGWLPEAGIEYRWEKRLGGWRKTPQPSPDGALRERAFAGYAAHMRTAEFRVAVDGVLDEATVRPTALMCAESLWWRCHRRLVADFVVRARATPVQHLMHDGRLQPHQPNEVARLDDEGRLVYDRDTHFAPRGNG